MVKKEVAPRMTKYSLGFQLQIQCNRIGNNFTRGAQVLKVVMELTLIENSKAPALTRNNSKTIKNQCPEKTPKDGEEA